ncbi:MAG TPA: hypothetical protein VFD47_08840, partial [Actinomycetota bacterium]|nr:hypothetical protein [Actinomycetota bacterium]
MGQKPYWMEEPGSTGAPPPPPPSEPPKRFSGSGVKVAAALLAVALIAVSAFAFVGYQRTNDLQDRLNEQERAQSNEQDDPENPLDDLGGEGDLDDLLRDFGGGGDLLGGSNSD